MPESPLTLDSNRLRNRIAELRLKQWWLAEQVGVDRKTVLRWVNGQVRSIQPANARLLAQVLGCAVNELTRPDGSHDLATVADQRAAGLALASSRLLDRLGPVGEWHVAEQLIRASAVPGLPLHVLGQLYHQLCVACWRQDKLAEAATHNAAALDIAERCGDHALRADALGSRANLRWWRGEVAAALADWQAALALARWLTPRQRGSLHSNLGAALYESGDLAAGRAELQAAAACFAEDGTPMNHAIVHGHLAMLALREGDLAAAESENARAEAWSRRGDYARGLALATLLRAEIAARHGQAEGALALLGQADTAYAAQGVDDAVNHVIAARVLRLAGHADAASQRLAQALQRARGFPLERAAVLAERARLEAMPPHVPG